MNRIKSLREEHDMTQSELGRLLNVKDAAVSKYESEKVPLTTETILKLSEIFSVSTDYILGRTNDRFPTHESEWRYPHETNRLGTILKKYRLSASLSEQDFSQKLDMYVDTYIGIEIGKFAPSLQLLQKISAITGYEVDYLTGALDSTLVPSGQDCSFGGKISPITYFESNSCFKARFEELRLRYGIGTDKTEEWLGLSHQEYIDILFNRMPTLSELLRLAYAFNVSADYLIGKTDAPISGLSEDEIELLLNYRDCLSIYKKNIRERAEKLALESMNPVAAGDNLKEAK